MFMQLIKTVAAITVKRHQFVVLTLQLAVEMLHAAQVFAQPVIITASVHAFLEQHVT